MDAITVFKSYIKSIFDYEVFWNEKFEQEGDSIFSSQYDEVKKKQIYSIFEKYLAKSISIDKQSRMQMLNFSIPPEHDLEVISSSGDAKKYEIITKENLSGHECRWIMVRENDGWRVFSKAYDFENWRVRKDAF